MNFDFTYEGIKYLNSLSYEAREKFLLEFYISVMDTEEAVGTVYLNLYFTELKGDVNGGGKVNTKDLNTLLIFNRQYFRSSTALLRCR